MVQVKTKPHELIQELLKEFGIQGTIVEQGKWRVIEAYYPLPSGKFLHYRYDKHGNRNYYIVDEIG